jgi:predicted deacylase
VAESHDGLIVGGRAVAPGERAAIRVPVTVGLNGAELALWVHVVRGRVPGPVLAVLSTLHGGEWFSIEVVRRLVQETDPATLRGTLITVPVANPPALALQTRNMPDESDSPDLNRIFPGTHTWRTDQLASAIAREVVQQASCLIDFHMGPWGSAFQDILIGDDLPKPGLSDECARLALAFGSPIIRRANVVAGFPGPKSSIGYASGVLGIPALGVEVGGVGFGERLEERWRQDTVRGVRGVMAALGMIDVPPAARPARQLIYRAAARANPTRGGFLRSRFAGDALAQEVAQGTLLGEVVSPYTRETIEELRAPARGLLFYVARDYPVQPGDWAYGLARIDDGTARWVDNVAAQAMGVVS